MADKIKVRVQAQAYEKYKPKTLLSEFENDTDFVDRKELLEEISALRQWILENVTVSGGGSNSAIAGGSLSGGDIANYSNNLIKNRISGNDVAIRAATPVRLYFYGGDVKQLLEAK